MFLTQVAQKTISLLLVPSFFLLVLPCYGQEHENQGRLLHDSAIVPATADIRSSRVAYPEPESTRQTPARITIDEDLLADFLDEPCDHFERARDRYLAGDAEVSARELRTAAAYLRLEAARATPEGRSGLESSIRELQQLAHTVENDQVHSVKQLEQVFARAHFALANYHCLNSARHGCQSESSRSQQDARRAGQDLKAAAINLRHGLRWTGDVPDAQLRRTLDRSLTAADRLSRHGESSQTELRRVVQSLRTRLEQLTGRKIMLAQPPKKQDPFGPAVFR